MGNRRQRRQGAREERAYRRATGFTGDMVDGGELPQDMAEFLIHMTRFHPEACTKQNGGIMIDMQMDVDWHNEDCGMVEGGK